ncbi:virulence factor SrfB [Obesumbacterium proteus]|uniref:virulence factor SrfB n=1 Tax=Obesumbacterium proteus TaxID=82983 RepID=UPI001F480353|nr:virulence factor SrfB [Obesumbacterium proteus]MCE9883560.1 virulence factor SrfB [Obesumbacterium proteus]MCE9915161.1 virulence factor SrfB [Obesumbacterium proteus]MCE9927931.1 virulence factor SrfB [Obesumbacterium proteus]MCG2875966.1 virulence factor SrfB [Obesumbacterium proteus]
MQANLIGYKANITLIKNSGVQFLDFGLATRTGNSGSFVRQSANGPLLRLDYDENLAKFTLPGENGGMPEIVRPEATITLEQSLAALDTLWLPLPFLRVNARHVFSGGPDNWARVQVQRLPTPDSLGNTVRLTLAFDTKIVADDASSTPLAPTFSDVRNGARFALAWRNHEVAEFLDQTWVDGWLRDVFVEYATRHEQRSEREIALALKLFEYQAHYLNLLEMLSTHLQVPEIQIVTETLQSPAIAVDLVMDVGNSHTCGVLTEDHGAGNEGLRQSTELHIRSLSRPQEFSEALFSSRLEFSEARFGKHHFSVESGREDAFTWPSIVRVGEEALTLAQQRQGTEGSSGLSSPRRYLWDDSPVNQAWRFSQPRGKSQREPRAMALPLTHLMNDEGQPLFSLPMDERLPVFTPHYSRSSLMTLMLCELLAQALSQINSASHRQNMGHHNAPRQLRNIILTLPSAMPKQEREIFRQRMEEAIGLVWKSMGWHPQDEAFYEIRSEEFSTVPVPKVQMEWDEATCGQLVWLYNEALINYAGQSGVFFQNLARPDRQLALDEPTGTTLRVASIDIGGGTTDMAIVQYQLDGGIGSNVKFKPHLLFREGFKVAGDDILLDVIQQWVLPCLEKALLTNGLTDAKSVMMQLFGEGNQNENENILRQQATLQILIPAAQAILAFWEKSNPQDESRQFEAKLDELLPQRPTLPVIRYLDQAIQPRLPSDNQAFSLLDVTLRVNMASLEEAMLSGRFTLTAPLKALSDVVNHYCCDVLLMTGRPTGLPGVQALLRYLQAVPANRIVWLHNYPVHERFPLGHDGYLSSPKSTAALGAMLCSLALDLRLPGFNFNAADIQAYSTIRHLGILDGSNILRDENVWYHDLCLDDTTRKLDTQLYFPLRGNACLGFRQLADVHWPASPLYLVQITSPELAKSIAGDGVLSVRLQYDTQNGGFAIVAAQMQDGSPVSLDQISLKLNTLADSYRGVTHYWIDSGSVYPK